MLIFIYIHMWNITQFWFDICTVIWKPVNRFSTQSKTGRKVYDLAITANKIFIDSYMFILFEEKKGFDKKHALEHLTITQMSTLFPDVLYVCDKWARNISGWNSLNIVLFYRVMYSFKIWIIEYSSVVPQLYVFVLKPFNSIIYCLYIQYST